MKNAIKKIICFLLASAILFSLSGCGKNVIYETYDGFFGSDVTLVVTGGDFSAAKRAWKTISKKLDDIKSVLSADESDFDGGKKSDVALFNSLPSGGKTEVTEATFHLIEESVRLGVLSGGVFNPCVFGLSDLWGFTSRFYRADYKKKEKYDRDFNSVGGFEDPRREYIDAFLRLADFSSLTTEQTDVKYYLVKTCPSVTVDGTTYEQRLDLSAVAKGYAADEVAPLLGSLGCDYYISFGGSSLYLGETCGGAWALKITDPSSKTRSSLGSVKVKNTFVSTAGTYERRYFTESGELRHHIIDGLTGSPADTDVLSVTLIGDDCSFSDGLSTALVAMGSKACLEYLENQTDYRYIVVTSAKKIFTDADLTLSDGVDYTVVKR